MAIPTGIQKFLASRTPAFRAVQADAAGIREQALWQHVDYTHSLSIKKGQTGELAVVGTEITNGHRSARPLNTYQMQREMLGIVNVFKRDEIEPVGPLPHSSDAENGRHSFAYRLPGGSFLWLVVSDPHQSMVVPSVPVRLPHDTFDVLGTTVEAEITDPDGDRSVVSRFAFGQSPLIHLVLDEATISASQERILSDLPGQPGSRPTPV